MMDLCYVESKAVSCECCELCKGRIKPVFARGNPKSGIVVCGMCPGFDENTKGVPFVGAAGKMLDVILGSVFKNDGCLDDLVYITNLVKCFVQPGKKLETKWMDACLSYFTIQLSLLKPKVIIGLGKDVCSYLLDINESISNMRGNIFNYMGIKFICTYHPSYLIRGGGVKHRDFNKVVDDFKTAVGLM